MNKETEILYGRNPVVEALKNGREANNIWTIKSTFNALRKELAPFRRSLKIVDKNTLAKITGRGDHQGIALKTETFRYTSFDAIYEIAEGIVLVADGITDPRNLGAIIRTAVLMGVKGIIIPEKHSSSITPVVCHTSAGATEHIAISKVKSLAHSLNILKDRGFHISGAVLPSEDAIDIRDSEYHTKRALVMGSEGRGIRNKIESLCHDRVYIPQKTDFDSFNVSIATSILLWEFRNKK